MNVAAVVLAARNEGDELEQGVAAKALLTLGGKPMAGYVLDALRASRHIGGVVYVGPTTPALAALADEVVPGGERVSESTRQGLEAALARFPGAERLLVTTGDLPWLEAAAVDDLLENAPEAALVYPVVARRVSEARFPQAKRTYARLEEGEFTGGNFFLLKPGAVPTLVPLVERFYRMRKNPVAAASVVGLGTLLKFALGRLSLEDAEARVSALAGVPVRTYQTPFASIGADVDKASHLEGFSAPPLGSSR
ncbi:MAG: nucleotidyltransferase family protein [Deinococcota bacterium]|jgi:molybdopterin-guanine dinucleotide biosynthesis protein A|nr:nucleotidyltransferase family protein [Deinococcota bacterium]